MILVSQKSVVIQLTGVGVACYLQVANVDAFARRLKKRRVKALLPPKTQFHGIRELQVVDLDGYRLVFYTPVAAGELPFDAAD